jgi:plastocyanin
MNKIYLFLSLILIASCTKIYDGAPGVGSSIPSNFIAVKDSSFTPALLDIVAGSTISFVNNTSSDKVIQSVDSLRIPATTIPAGQSFIFKSNTAGSFEYFRKDKPAVRGIINLRP